MVEHTHIHRQEIIPKLHCNQEKNALKNLQMKFLNNHIS